VPSHIQRKDALTGPQGLPVPSDCRAEDQQNRACTDVFGTAPQPSFELLEAYYAEVPQRADTEVWYVANSLPS
jgi:hypothetical protein